MTYSETIFTEFREILKTMIANYGIVSNSDGLYANLKIILSYLEKAGFHVEVLKKEGQSDIVIAKRVPVGTTDWVGLYGHYDVEPVEDGWLTNPLELTEKDGRLYGRGVGDDLGPLILRLLAAVNTKDADYRPGLVWLLQGEEEIASPFAHEEFQRLKLPEVKFWLDETGYFSAERGQRFLVKNPSPVLETLLHELMETGKRHGFNNYIEERYLNKAFGEYRCPYLVHIVKGQPYIAIGPNDDTSNIHAPNESIPISTFQVSFEQFSQAISIT